MTCIEPSVVTTQRRPVDPLDQHRASTSSERTINSATVFLHHETDTFTTQNVAGQYREWHSLFRCCRSLEYLGFWALVLITVSVCTTLLVFTINNLAGGGKVNNPTAISDTFALTMPYLLKSYVTEANLFPVDEESEPSPSQSKRLLEVFAEEDIIGLKSDIQTIRIRSLPSFHFSRNSFNHSIDTLEIVGVLKFSVLSDVLNEFKEIRSLGLDFKGYKHEIYDELYSNNSENISLPSLANLEIRNLNGHLLPFGYVLKIQTHKLTNITFSSCNFREGMFESLQDLVTAHFETIESLKILDCYFCDSCNLRQVKLKRGILLQILGRKYEPI